MAGYSRIFVLGTPGGFMGADGIGSIEVFILVGDGDRQWLTARAIGCPLAPLGRLTKIIPTGPDLPGSILDACIAFCPAHFEACPALARVRQEIGSLTTLDFDAAPHTVPPSWEALRDEARPVLDSLHLWRAALVPWTLTDRL